VTIRALAVALALWFMPLSVAQAWSVDEDLALARSVLPAGHPCRAGVRVELVPGLRVLGNLAMAAAPQGVLVDGRWWAVSGPALVPLPCEVSLNPDEWRVMPACDRRRVMLHEVWGHLGGHVHAEGGLMGPHAERVAVPGCPAVLPGLVDRASDLVMARVPVGWEVSCGLARPGVVGCSASRGRAVRRYRVTRRGRLVVARVRTGRYRASA
jgi:hypothetical protein